MYFPDYLRKEISCPKAPSAKKICLKYGIIGLFSLSVAVYSSGGARAVLFRHQNFSALAVCMRACQYCLYIECVITLKNFNGCTSCMPSCLKEYYKRERLLSISCMVEAEALHGYTFSLLPLKSSGMPSLSSNKMEPDRKWWDHAVVVGPVEEEVGPVEEGVGPVEEGVGPVEEGVGPVEEEVGPVEEGVGPVEEEVGPVEEEVGPVEEYRWDQ